MNDVRAFCGSEICDKHGETAYGIQKLVAKHTSFCPDCGHALVWKKKNSVIHTSSSAKRKGKDGTPRRESIRY